MWTSEELAKFDSRRVRSGRANLSVKDRIHRALLNGKEPKTEYEAQKLISWYLNTYHPAIEYRVDFAGSNLSEAQARKNQTVNKRRGWMDIEIYDGSGEYCGLCIELKKNGERIRLKSDSKIFALIKYRRVKNKLTRKTERVAVRESFKRKAGDYANLHLQEQGETLERMRERGRIAGFGIGVINTLWAIESYLSDDPEGAYEHLQT